MIPHGSLSIERKLVPWSKAGSDGSDGYWAVAAVGVLAGIAVTYARTPIHLPGHKALWWMVPVLATRLATRTSGGAMAGALATALTTLCLGGRLAGGVALMPLLIAGGFVLDVAARISQQRHLSPLHRALLFALAGAIANSICFGKRVADPVGAFSSTMNVKDLLTAAGSHALFGLIAGLLGAGVGYTLARKIHEGQCSRK